MKKRMSIKFILSFLLLSIVFIMPLVIAQDFRAGSERIINTIVDSYEPILQALFGGTDYTGYLLFEKFLIFILLFSMVFLSLKEVTLFEGRQQKPILITVSTIVALLSVRFLSYEWLNTILLQYQTIGIAIIAILPFIIYLFFVHNVLSDYKIARKIAWIFFIVIYFGLWTTSESNNYGEVYLWTMGIAVIFFFFDGTIHRHFIKQRWAESERGGIYKYIAELDEEIEKMEKSNIPEKQKKNQLKKLYKRRIGLSKRL